MQTNFLVNLKQHENPNAAFVVNKQARDGKSYGDEEVDEVPCAA